MGKRIGIDIDGVIVDIVLSSIAYLNKKLKKEYTRQDFVSYFAHDWADVTEEEMANYYKQPKAYKFPYLWESIETIRMLNWFGYDLYAVTARPKEVHQYTLDWAKKEKLPFKDVIFANSHDKIDIAKKLNLSYFVEDKLETAIDLSKFCEKVFLLAAPYNMSDDLPANVYRVYSWSGISKEMTKCYARGE